MKISKRWGILILALLLAGTWSACGKETKVGDMIEKLSAGEAVLSSAAKMKKADSLSADIEIDMEISLLGQNMQTDAELKMSCLNNPRKIHNEIDVDMGMLGNRAYEVYAEEEKEAYNIYMKGDSGWETKKVPKSDIGQYDIKESLDFYLNHVEELSAVGEEELSGIKTERYEGIIRGDAVLTIMKNLKILDMIKEISDSNFEIEDSMFENLDEIPVKIWIDAKTGYLLQCDMSMTGAAKKLLSNVISQVDGIAGSLARNLKLDLSSLELSMECSDYNEVPEFKMPET